MSVKERMKVHVIGSRESRRDSQELIQSESSFTARTINPITKLVKITKR
jgi:hypothetical protein